MKLDNIDLRDWFAGMALPSLIAIDYQLDDGGFPRELARDAYKYADAMMRARDEDAPTESPRMLRQQLEGLKGFFDENSTNGGNA